MKDNKLIAEFMGIELDTESYRCGSKMTYEDWLIHSTQKNMRFHESWDWLMPVVEKIEEIAIDDTNLIVKEHRFEFDMGYTQCKIYDHNGVFEVIYGDMGSKLLSTYQAVVEFIKTYNNGDARTS
jgi:hypothetical protein